LRNKSNYSIAEASQANTPTGKVKLEENEMAVIKDPVVYKRANAGGFVYSWIKCVNMFALA
jgi:hypothetical protein